MTLPVTINNFLGGSKGPEGQYRGDVTNSFVHAENFIVERDGALRNRPAIKEVDIDLLDTDYTVSFMWEEELYTLVYDPLMNLEFRQSNDVPSADEILDNYDYFDSPKFDLATSLGKGKDRSRYPEEVRSLYDLFIGDNTLEILQVKLQETLDALKPQENLYKLYLGALLDRDVVLNKEYYYLLNIGQQAIETGASPSEALQKYLDDNPRSIIRVRETGELAFWRFLIYKKDTLISTTINGLFPMTYLGPLPQRIEYTEFLSAENYGNREYRKNAYVDVGRNISYRATLGINDVYLVNPEGRLPPLVIDMRNASANKVTLYDMRASWTRLSKDVASDNPKGIIEIHSFLTEEEFKASGNVNGAFSNPTTADTTAEELKAIIDGPKTNPEETHNLQFVLPFNAKNSDAPMAHEPPNPNVDFTSIIPDSPINDNLVERYNRSNTIHFRLPKRYIRYMGRRSDEFLEFKFARKFSGNDLTPQVIRDQVRDNSDNDFMSPTLFYNQYPIMMPVRVDIVNTLLSPDRRWGSTKTSKVGNTRTIGANESDQVRSQVGKTLSFYNPSFNKHMINQHESVGGNAEYQYNHTCFYPVHFMPQYVTKTEWAGLQSRRGPGTIDQIQFRKVTPEILVEDTFDGNAAAAHLRAVARFFKDTYDISMQPDDTLDGGHGNLMYGDYSVLLTWDAQRNDYIAYGLNVTAFYQHSEALNGRVGLFFTREKPNALAFTRNIGASEGRLEFSEGDNLKGDPENPNLDNGFRLFWTPEGGGLKGFWTFVFNGILNVGTSRGNVTFSQLNVSALNELVFARQDSPSRFRPVDSFTASYQVLNDKRSMFILEKSEELQRTKYVSLTASIGDYIPTTIDSVYSIQDIGILMVLTNEKRLFIGTIKENGRVGWTELTFGRDIQQLHEANGLLIINARGTIATLDLKEITGIEADAKLTLTLPSPLAYVIKSNAKTPDRVAQYTISKGIMIGDLQQPASVGSRLIPNQYSSSRAKSVQFGAINLKNEDDSPHFEFRGRKVRISSAFFDIEGV